MDHRNRFTRQLQLDIPEFHSYEEACHFFQEEFGDQFTTMKDHFEVNGDSCFEHHIVVDPVAYEEGRKQLVQASQNETLTITNEELSLVDEAEYSAIDYLMSFHPIQIRKDGSIHIVF